MADSRRAQPSRLQHSIVGRVTHSAACGAMVSGAPLTLWPSGDSRMSPGRRPARSAGPFGARLTIMRPEAWPTAPRIASGTVIGGSAAPSHPPRSVRVRRVGIQHPRQGGVWDHSSFIAGTNDRHAEQGAGGIQHRSVIRTSGAASVSAASARASAPGRGSVGGTIRTGSTAHSGCSDAKLSTALRRIGRAAVRMPPGNATVEHSCAGKSLSDVMTVSRCQTVPVICRLAPIRIATSIGAAVATSEGISSESTANVAM